MRRAGGAAGAGAGPVACRAVNLSVAYRDEAVLANVTLEVPTGVVMGIVGPNGAGKSTLIKAMLGLVPPLTGATEFFGSPLARVRGRVGYMPQAASVDWDFPTTVLDAVTMGTYGRLGWIRRPGRAERTRAREALEHTGIAELAARQAPEGGRMPASSSHRRHTRPTKRYAPSMPESVQSKSRSGGAANRQKSRTVSAPYLAIMSVGSTVLPLDLDIFVPSMSTMPWLSRRANGSVTSTRPRSCKTLVKKRA